MANSESAILRKTVTRLYDAFRESAEGLDNVSAYDVSIRQHQTMALVCRLTEDKPHGVTLKELAEAMKLAPATVSELVESLVKKNLLERIQNPDDRRAVQITLTKHGQSLLNACIQQVDALCERVLAILEPDERENLLRGLTKITEHV